MQNYLFMTRPINLTLYMMLPWTNNPFTVNLSKLWSYFDALLAPLVATVDKKKKKVFTQTDDSFFVMASMSHMSLGYFSVFKRLLTAVSEL